MAETTAETTSDPSTLDPSIDGSIDGADDAVTVERTEQYDVVGILRGGGVSGQAGALRLAIARALIEVEPEDRPALKKAGFLTRDPRVIERKKYGLKKARKAPQYSKR